MGIPATGVGLSQNVEPARRLPVPTFELRIADAERPEDDLQQRQLEAVKRPPTDRAIAVGKPSDPGGAAASGLLDLTDVTSKAGPAGD
jgi:hypothetical protein